MRREISEYFFFPLKVSRPFFGAWSSNKVWEMRGEIREYLHMKKKKTWKIFAQRIFESLIFPHLFYGRPRPQGSADAVKGLLMLRVMCVVTRT
jgi:hypothetical protein